MIARICKWCGHACYNPIKTRYGYYCNVTHAEKGAEYRTKEIAEDKAREIRKLERKLSRLKGKK
jgi:hypothetical protein